MRTELITTGTELLLGRVLNTHQAWLGERLADLNCPVDRQVSVPDKGADIQDAVREALSRADLIVTTGGLGPTSDDLTRELMAELLGVPLIEDAAVLAHIEAFFSTRKRAVPPGSRCQAQVPLGAKVLQNSCGTAPGLILTVEPGQFRMGVAPSRIVMLPGPPRELRPMFLEQVSPLIRQFVPDKLSFVCRTLRTTGIGESVVEGLISPPLSGLVTAGLMIGYCARVGEVDVRLSAQGPHATETVTAAEVCVRELLHHAIYGSSGDELESIVMNLLIENGLTVATAESCTGGYLAHRLTNVPGASGAFRCGYVTYSNESKTRLLSVNANTLAQCGAVSEAVAREMAEGARREAGSDFAISVTGIAGPSGGTPQKPVGTVFIGVAGPQGSNVISRMNPYDRETFKQVTSQQALELLRRTVLASAPTPQHASDTDK